MRGRTAILFLLAAILAGGTALLVRSSLSHRPPVTAANTPSPPPTPQTRILVAATAIARGQILKPIDFVWRPWLDNPIAADFIIAVAASEKPFTGWVAREPFVAGEPIIKSKLVAPGDRGFLAAVLHPGTRAVSIAVTQTSDVSGFIFPGDRVDVLITLPLPAEGTNGNGYAHKVAQTVVRDVRVVAIDQRLDAKGGQAVLARTVTLELNPKQSEIVALADEIGKVSLSLRSLVADPEDKPASAVLSEIDGSPPATSVRSDAGEAGEPGGYTLDSEISRLLPKLVVKHNLGDGKVTILRGNGNPGGSAGSPPGS